MNILNEDSLGHLKTKSSKKGYARKLDETYCTSVKKSHFKNIQQPQEDHFDGVSGLTISARRRHSMP